MKLTEFASAREQQRIDELLPLAGLAARALAGGAARGSASLAKAAGSALATGAKAAGSTLSKATGALSGTPVTPTGGAAQKAAQQAAGSTELGPIDIINAIKDPKIAQQLKVMKQKIPGGNLDAMVDPKGAQDQQKQIQDLGKALDTLKKNAGIK